ncbi:P-loop containing nucleoside triphosphate hydrolase protein [Pisolithus croceorrhizus]|nr:P-loop containing nucleoside triphosphate hydrolase protein [Pisolithus croceorrhizus]
MGKGCIYGIEVEQGAEQIVPDCIWYRFNEPFFLCAPTGAGKTNVAMLTILHELAKHRNDQTGEFALDTFKVVYVAPTKALIQEMVSSFSSRLLPFSIKVGELTGDSDDEATNCQDANYSHDAGEVGCHYSSTDMSCTNLVHLMIVDEIHLLHDKRGPLSNYGHAQDVPLVKNRYLERQRFRTS